MASYVADYFPAQTGVWISTDYVEKLDWKTLGRLQDCLDEEAAAAVAKTGGRPNLTPDAEIKAGDKVLIFDSQNNEEEPPLYREFWYGGTTDEYYAREAARREKREQELAEGEARRAQADRAICAKSAARRDAEWKIGGFRD